MGLLSPGMALSSCPSCGSRFLQPLRCEPQGDHDVLVDLRCPECMTHLKAPYTRADMAELDRLQIEWRGGVVAAHQPNGAGKKEGPAARPGPAGAPGPHGARHLPPRPPAPRPPRRGG